MPTSEPYYQDDSVTLYHGDSLDVLKSLPDASVDSVVTDPPYGLGFMGKEWDDLPPGLPFAAECLRVLKPGGHMLSFGGSRTWHRLVCAIEDAGFEIRDSIAWLYGGGFPKSLDVSKAIDKLDASHERDGRATRFTSWMRTTGLTAGQIDKITGTFMGSHYLTDKSQAAIATAQMFDLLRPHLPIVPASIEALVAERSIESENFNARAVVGARVTGIGTGRGGTSVITDNPANRTVTAAYTPEAEQWQGWGTALKPAFEPVVVARKPFRGTVAANVLENGTGALNIAGCRVGDDARRWPANVILDESQADELDAQTGELTSGANPTRRGTDKFREAYGDFKGQKECEPARGADSGGASRFFYTAKASQAERLRVDGVAHPTVKPLDLMRWLARLVTPPGGIVLEPFAGSGTTVEACILEGFKCIAIEREADYLPLIKQRINRRRDPVAYVKASGDDGGLFDLLDGDTA